MAQIDKRTKKAKKQKIPAPPLAGRGSRLAKGNVGTKAKAKKLTIKSPNFKPWFENKIKTARKLGKHRAARAAGRFGTPAGVALIVLISLVSFLSPKSDFEKAKERLAKNPNDFDAHLDLAEKFLENNQYEEAEKILLLAQKNHESRISNFELESKTLGKKVNAKFEKLWERKTYSDPEEIQKLINAWEEIVKEKPDYRDGHLQLALLYYKIFEDQKAKEHLEKAIGLDPNCELARKLEKVISNE